MVRWDLGTDHRADVSVPLNPWMWNCRRRNACMRNLIREKGITSAGDVLWTANGQTARQPDGRVDRRGAWGHGGVGPLPTRYPLRCSYYGGGERQRWVSNHYHCICIALHLHSASAFAIIPLACWFRLVYGWWIRWIDGWTVTPVNMIWELAPEE